MKRILTAGEMKSADEAAMNMGLPSLVLMERAALSVLEVIDEEELDTSDVCVLCGTGNNGGDGVAVARLLAERGEKVRVLFPLGTEKSSEQLASQIKVMEHYRIPVASGYTKGRYTLVIDALFGIGLSREIGGSLAGLIRKVNEDTAYVLSVDIASGLDGNSGKILGTAVRADATVTFAAAKRGHFLGEGKNFTGRLFVKEIGIPVGGAACRDALYAIEDDDFSELPDRDQNGNKGTFGKLLVIAGSDTICGAAYLAAAAALKSGVGMVRIFTSEKNRTALSVLLPEALIDTYEEGQYETESLAKAYEWADAAVIGPGLSTGTVSKKILKDYLQINRKPAVIDADALNILAEEPELWKKVKFPCTITPHAGEMGRLCGMSTMQVKTDPVSAASAFAAGKNVVCILKDAATVTAYPDGKVYLNTSGCSALATAGSGDVLAGLTAGFLLQYRGSDLPVAAMAVYYHGCMGEAAADLQSEESVTAGDLLKILSE